MTEKLTTHRAAMLASLGHTGAEIAGMYDVSLEEVEERLTRAKSAIEQNPTEAEDPAAQSTLDAIDVILTGETP